jgi:hypothetical protein
MLEARTPAHYFPVKIKLLLEKNTSGILGVSRWRKPVFAPTWLNQLK